MATFLDKNETIIVTDNTDYNSLIPSGRSNYNVYCFFFDYKTATEYVAIDAVVPNTVDSQTVSNWTLTFNQDSWIKSFMLRLQRLASDPNSPVEKDSYYNTVDSKAYYYNGTEWIEFNPEVFDKDIVNYITDNHLRKLQANILVNDIQKNVADRNKVDDNCCDDNLNKYIILHTALVQSQIKFDVGNHIGGLDRINYIHENQ